MMGRLVGIACGIALMGACISFGGAEVSIDPVGLAEKGPFVGGLVTVRVFDATLTPTDEGPGEGTIGDDGFWQVDDVRVSGELMRVEVQGAWLDETTGQVSDDVGRLRAYMPSIGFDPCVNVMGHLSSWRFEELVAGGGDPMEQMIQAVDDVLTALDLPGQAASMGWDVQLRDDTAEGEALLMLSAMVQQGRSVDGAQRLLDDLGQDLADGTLDDLELLAALEASAFTVDPDRVGANLMAHWATFEDDSEAPDFSDMLQAWIERRDPDGDCVGTAQEILDGTDPDVADGDCRTEVPQ